MIKIIDRLLVKSFLPPFIVVNFIAIFVLVMQFLWKWIDEIAGKGVGTLFILEMLGYLSISFLPLAFLIAILVSSVMVLGSLAERYELSSMQSAGVSLARIMFPLTAFTIGISAFSYVCSDVLIPFSNLKYQSRLYDIKHQKPTLSLEVGVFNDDFQGYSINISGKKSDNKTIESVLMYDQSPASSGKYSQISAKTGEMFVTKDEKFFVLKLYDGHQYLETRPSYNQGETTYPFVRTNFKESTKVFDLREFEVERTDEELFKSHHSMLSTKQLKIAIDSIDQAMLNRLQAMKYEVNRSLYFVLKEEKAKQDTTKQETQEIPTENTLYQYQDTTYVQADTLDASLDSVARLVDTATATKALSKSKPLRERISASVNYSAVVPQLDSLVALQTYPTFLETFRKEERRKLLNNARNIVSTVQSGVSVALNAAERQDESRRKHLYAMHNKFSTAAMCFIFLFIGAPIGAIIRKGGYGFPLIFSISLFVTYVMLTILFKKTMEGNGMDAVLAAWMPCIIMFPVGLILTYLSMQDTKLALPEVSRIFKIILSAIKSLKKLVGAS
ncbi:MAG: YjgP/YjgQ family permease [Saprospiraceae bacterium]|nr:YjgP/YjgQ family permease [Saprospiraceae bacterium]